MSDGALLSVAELQTGYRELLRDARASRTPGPARPVERSTDRRTRIRNRLQACDPNDAGSFDIPAGWNTVLAAHAGAGASTVALALADAAADGGRAVHLIEATTSGRSGLAAAARAELGVAADGGWRTGRRAGVTIDRRVGEADAGWPKSIDDVEPVTIVDLGLLDQDDLDRLTSGGTACVVVCRVSIPGVRSVVRTLDALAERSVVVAALGPGRWAGEVTSSLGPRLRHLRADGGVVTVPVERHLAITGPTQMPLPKSVLAAARSLLKLIEPDHRDSADATPRRAPRPKGIPR